MLFEERFHNALNRLKCSLDTAIEKHGLLRVSLFVASIFFFLAMIYVRPGFPFLPGNMVGNDFASYILSENPFSLEGNAAAGTQNSRIGIPLLSWAIGLRGQNLAYTMSGLLFLFVFSVFFRYAHQNENILAACAITSVFVFSYPFLFSLHELGNLDAVRVFVTLLMIWAAPKRLLFWTLFLLNAFIHEGAVVFLPLFLLLRWPHRKSVTDFVAFDLILSLFLFGLFFTYYSHVGGHSGYLAKWTASSSSFIDATRANLQRWAWYGYSGIFSAFRLYWIIPIVAILVALKDRRIYDLLLILTPIGAVIVFLIVSWESTRMAYTAAPMLAIAFDQLCKKYGTDKVSRSIIFIGFLNVFLPVLNSYNGGPLEMTPSLPHYLLFLVF